MELKSSALKILSKPLQRQQKKIELETEWERTSPTAPKEYNSDDEDDEGSPKVATGKKRLYQIYGGGQPKVCSELLRANSNYNKVINHLEEHVKEDAGDPKDTRQALQLRREVARNKLMCPSGGSVSHLQKEILASRTPKRNPIWKVSNPKVASQRIKKLFGKKAKLYLANDGKAKYKLQRPDGKWVKFGAIAYEDFLHHLDFERREHYLQRASAIRGNWRDDPYSANLLAQKILW
jgi:hypothetical protein